MREDQFRQTLAMNVMRISSFSWTRLCSWSANPAIWRWISSPPWIIHSSELRIGCYLFLSISWITPIITPPAVEWERIDSSKPLRGLWCAFLHFLEHVLVPEVHIRPFGGVYPLRHELNIEVNLEPVSTYFFQFTAFYRTYLLPLLTESKSIPPNPCEDCDERSFIFLSTLLFSIK